jgi:hypothetical protein
MKIVNPSKTFDVGGDPLTVLCNWKSYILYDNVHPDYYTWKSLFVYTKVVDASKLIITDNPKYQICARMFQECSSLEVAPELPMTELSNGCY